MSLVDVQGVNLVPGFMVRAEKIPSGRTIRLDAAGELCGAVIQIPRTGNISKLGFMLAGVLASDTLKISLQTVDPATGRPTGTLIDADAFSTQSGLTNNTPYYVSMQNPVAVTRGDIVAFTVEFDNFVAGNLLVRAGIIGFPDSSIHFPYIFQFVGSAWAFQDDTPTFSLEYDDDVIEPVLGSFPIASTDAGTIDWDTNDNPDRRGLRFSVSYNCRFSGIFFMLDLDANADIEIYDNDGTTLLETISLDSDLRTGITAGSFSKLLVTPIELTRDTFYRIMIHPTTGTNIKLYSIDVKDDGAVPAMNAIDGGVNFHYTTVNGVPTAEGDYTQLLTKRPLIGLMLDQLDDGLPLNIVTGAVVTGQDTVGTIVGG